MRGTGATPLHRAVAVNVLPSVRLLLRVPEVDLAATNWAGQTAADSARVLLRGEAEAAIHAEVERGVVLVSQGRRVEGGCRAALWWRAGCVLVAVYSQLCVWLSCGIACASLHEQACASVRVRGLGSGVEVLSTPP